MQPYHLAQFNIARMLAPLHDPIMATFVEQLEEINTIADNTPGFIWRLVGDDAIGATSIRPYEDDRWLINLSVWESIEALSDYVYRSQHGRAMRTRRDWFEKSDQATFVLWWIQAGQIPTVEEAQIRLEHLRQHGTTPTAFTFRQPFPSPIQHSEV
ncbi:DUF3291 domain-containing protein [Leptolyngbya sp. AN03gr2]|uniref:DUF3291 domain-containing protein n=1 Tax=unclassified Leptolyngbya TaxID=2650499 RepID=UPI003D30FFFE